MENTGLERSEVCTVGITCKLGLQRYKRTFCQQRSEQSFRRKKQHTKGMQGESMCKELRIVQTDWGIGHVRGNNRRSFIGYAKRFTLNPRI